MKIRHESPAQPTVPPGSNVQALPPRVLALSLALLLGATPSLSAHDDTQTHARLSIASFLFLDQTFPEDAALFDNEAREGIRQGSIDEDDGVKFQHHFYNPKTRQTMGLFAQTAPARASNFWNAAVAAFRTNDQATTRASLGAVLHLLQDMTSPAHVHLDNHGKVRLGHCEGDGDDFEVWGYCDDIGTNAILQYVRYNGIGDTAIRPYLAVGLEKIFTNRPQGLSPQAGANTAYRFVHEVANKVYDFTTFGVTLRDTINPNDPGDGELWDMFPSLEETTAPAAWWIRDVGYSQGECVYTTATAFNESWWIMPGCTQGYQNLGTVYEVKGMAYIENTGGGSGGSAGIFETLIPEEYNRPWFIARYGSKYNTANRSMLRIYGDVLYPAAVAYGAGLLQAFLDEAVMPRPITRVPVAWDGSRVELNGQANAGNASAIAWFEWNLAGGGPTHRTSSQAIGGGSGWIQVSAPLSGLAPATTYQCRLVSSNRFGVRHGTNLVFRTPSFLLSGQGVNAWQITDDSTAAGSVLYYTNVLSDGQRMAATNQGFRFSVHARVLSSFNGSKTMNMIYGLGARRFQVWFYLDSHNDLIAEVQDGLAYKLTTDGFGDALHHTHEIIYNPANQTARYEVDGVVKTNNWPPIPVAWPAGTVHWGAGSSAGKARMNFHRVSFEITNTAVALYEAGAAGNPPVAPDPVEQGWRRYAGAAPISEGPISPDAESFLADVETLAASGLGLQGVQLNGRVDPRGSAAVAWFEWGLDAGYGNVTAPQSVPSGNGWANVHRQLAGLTQDTTYHYRIVASNSFGVRFGDNRTFLTPSYLLTGVLPNAWQITDGSSEGGSTFNYRTNLTLAQRLAATNSGWRFSVTSRMTPGFQGAKTMTFLYDFGATRFLVWWDLDASGNLTSELEGQAPRIVATAEAATNYHTHELIYDPTNRMASYWLDGSFVASWTGSTLGSLVGEVVWGAGSSPGMGQMNFHRAEFAIASLGTVAAYDAGNTGNPMSEPNPSLQGWTLHAASAPTLAALSPDAVPVAPAEAETQAASAVGPNAAQLNASVNTKAQPTAVWFEWGTTSGYGQRTTPQAISGPSGTRPFAQAVAGLTVDTLYHYRVVASNAFAVSFGSDHTFRTRWFQDSGIALAAVDVGSVAWGDYDNDGDLDLIITGQSDTNHVTQLYRNQGGTNLVPVPSGLPPVNRGAVAWGDFDNDGFVDLLISGWNETGTVSRVYRNRQDGTFLDRNAGLPGLTWSTVAWADYDQDGDLDFLLSGLDDATNGIARIYRNDRGTNFVDINAGLPGVSQGSAAWADFDGDGDPDLMLTGHANSQIPISRLYRNEGGGVFAEVPADLPGVEAGSVAWGDYDSDGDPDLLLTGWDGGTYVTRLYGNERNGPESTFVSLPANLPGISSSSVAWGDFDHDGDLDILMTGWSGSRSTRVFRNEGAQMFVDVGAGLVGMNWSSAAWADYDRDGDLDFLATGSTDTTRVCRLYRNEASVSNAPPAAPSGLAGAGVGSVATFHWDLAADDVTPGPALSYNLILATNGTVLTSPMSDGGTGFRRVVRSGNADQNLEWTITGLKPGTYQFTVQAIDSALAGGPFAPWQTVQVAPDPVVIYAQDIPQPGQFRIRFVGAEGASYEVWRSTNLSNWTAIGPGLEAAPGLFEFRDTAAPAAGGFYRVRTSTE